jgi:PhzF family phenazine biosynthesis protein
VEGFHLMLLPLRQVDVFATTPFSGNPVAVVLAADELDTAMMQRIANWTNLAETTFVLRPDSDEADYRLRIFTPSRELPFAGHPTLGSCHAWLETNDQHPNDVMVLQECEAGLIRIRQSDTGLAFAAPPLLRSGAVEETLVAHLAALLGIEREDVVDSQWVDNGPGWVAVLLRSAEAVVGLRPGVVDMNVGVVGPHPAGSPEAIEVRAFTARNGATVEDPVTGSLNASLAQWLVATGRAATPYLARQGTALTRAGRIHVDQDADGTIWVGGATVTRVEGEILL